MSHRKNCNKKVKNND